MFPAMWIIAGWFLGVSLSKARKSLDKLPKPVHQGKRDIDTIEKILKPYVLKNCEYEWDDPYKLKYEKKYFEDFYLNDDTNYQQYMLHLDDCEDRTRKFLALLNDYMPGACVGEIKLYTQTGKHSKVVFIDEFGVPWEFEPQTDKIEILKREAVYKVRI